MTVKLLDYAGKAVEVDVGDINDIGSMRIRVVTGDEILTVVHKDFTVEEFDSSGCRMRDFWDGEYEIYSATTGLNELNREAFINRTSSYWFYDDDEEDEEP